MLSHLYSVAATLVGNSLVHVHKTEESSPTALAPGAIILSMTGIEIRQIISLSFRSIALGNKNALLFTPDSVNLFGVKML